MKTVFLRAVEASDKAAALRVAIHERPDAEGANRFEVEPSRFTAVSRSPFAYWVSDGVRRLFTELAPFEADGREAWVGLQTNDDFRWIRLWHEVPLRHLKGGRSGTDWRAWVPYAKGGEYARYYAPLHLTVEWGGDGRAIKAWKLEELRLRKITANNSQCWNESKYFRAGLTWSQRSQVGLSVRPLPAGSVFGIKGPAAFCGGADESLAFLALVNSAPFRALVAMQMAFGSYDTGVIRRTPVPALDDAERRRLAALARVAWRLSTRTDSRREWSRGFTLPALVAVGGERPAARVSAWVEGTRAVELELAETQAAIDERCFAFYGIDENDRRAISRGFTGSLDRSAMPDEQEGDGADEDGDEGSADAAALAAELVSWAVGAAFGRFDVRLATGARALPAEPEPFDPVSVCPPAMLISEDGLPLERAPADYPLPFPVNGILADDPGHSSDLGAAVRSVFDEVFGTASDTWWDEIAVLLDPSHRDLRQWLASTFFEHHLKRYSKSRRKAPILWQLSTRSGRYSVWLYAHRLTRDSFFQIQNDIVVPKLAHEERRLADLAHSAGDRPSAKDRKDIDAQETLLDELRALVDEVKRVTPLWNPTLDDGVVLTMAPLWRLVPQHKHWQKELKNNWDELAAGKYDWAHLAMHLWPERVVPKCAADRSLAIAHGLEETFWVEGADGKWKARATPARSVEELVRERIAPAVKAALKSLLEAPVGGAENGFGLRRPAAVAASDGGTR